MKKLRQEQAAGWTKQELAEYYGIKSWDGALPQQWLEEMARKVSEYTGYLDYGQCYDLIRAGTVWHYPEGSIIGEPFYFDHSVDILAKVAGRKQDGDD